MTAGRANAAELNAAADVPKLERTVMRSHEKPDRGRPPPDISWRKLAQLDPDGLTLIGVFFGTLLMLGAIFLLAIYNAHA
jgi:hypothetical protein